MIGTDADLAPGGSTNLAVTLNRPAPAGGVTINAFMTGDTGSFTVPMSVNIPAGASSASLSVEANADAVNGHTVQVRLSSGADYILGTAGPLTFTVNDALSALPDAILSGEDATIAPGDTVTLSVTISPPAQDQITLNMLATGVNIDRFVVNGVVPGPQGTIQIPASDSFTQFTVRVSSFPRSRVGTPLGMLRRP